MKVDRSLVGVIGIAIVLSTMITLFIIGERAEEDVTILRNEFPATLSTMEQKYAFVLSMIARKPLEQVKVKYNILRRVLPENIVYLDANHTTGDNPSETLMNLAKLHHTLDQANYVGAQPDVWNGTVEWKNATRTHTFDMYMYDFTDMVKASAPSDTGLGVTSTYVVWLNQTNGSIFYYFEGISDYFYNRNRTIVDLTITHNDESEYYRAVSEIEVEGKYEQIMEAPMFGTVTFEEVEKDDRLFVIFSLKGTTVPGHNGMLQLVRVYKNGEMESFRKNYMRR
jgi:hypothetical protein